MPWKKTKAGIAGMVMITGTMIFTTQPNNEAKAASCPDLPKVAWWKTNHDKIVKYVDQRYDGKWEPYLNKWRHYKNKMQAIHAKDGTAIVKSRGIRLKGDNLKKHIGDVEKRILVTQCLQRKHSGRLALSNSTDIPSIVGTRSSLAKIFQALKIQAMRYASPAEGHVDDGFIGGNKSSPSVTSNLINLEVSAR